MSHPFQIETTLTNRIRQWCGLIRSLSVSAGCTSHQSMPGGFLPCLPGHRAPLSSCPQGQGIQRSSPQAPWSRSVATASTLTILSTLSACENGCHLIDDCPRGQRCGAQTRRQHDGLQRKCAKAPLNATGTAWNIQPPGPQHNYSAYPVRVDAAEACKPTPRLQGSGRIATTGQPRSGFGVHLGSRCETGKGPVSIRVSRDGVRPAATHSPASCLTVLA